MPELPDFNALTASMTAASNGLGSAAIQLGKLQNLPVINFLDQLNRMEQTQLRILRELGDLRNELHQNVGELRQNVGELCQIVGELRQNVGELRQNVGELHQNVGDLRQDFNRADGTNFARLMNAKVTSDNTALVHLLGPDNAAIPNFPATSAQIRAMNGVAINNLLIAFGLPVDGNIDDRKNRFRRHIGLTVL